MLGSRLRIYYGPEEDGSTVQLKAPAEQQRVTVPLGDVFPALADAVRSGRTWIDDFADEEVTLSQDLYEVILAYQHFHRPSA